MRQIKYMIFAFCLIPFSVIADCNVKGVEKDAPVICGYATQGGILYGQATGWDVYAGVGDKEKISKDDVFVFGLGRDAPKDVKIMFCKIKDCQTYTYKIAQRKYIEQKVNVADKYIKYSDDVQKRIDKDNDLIVKERENSLKYDSLEFMKFVSPLDLSKYRVSSVYGTRRIFNGVPKSPHKGIDIAAPDGTPVYAAAAGKVIIVSDMYMSGNTVFIAHGHGVTSAYLHLSKIDVTNGQRIVAGDVVGKVGSTGRSSGAHLHFGIYWGQDALDPELFLK